MNNRGTVPIFVRRKWDRVPPACLGNRETTFWRSLPCRPNRPAPCWRTASISACTTPRRRPRGSSTSACKQYLAHHPGVVFFAVGTRAEDFAWSISDLAFDVALQLVFRSKADHDRYQESPEHVRFIEENEANWKAIRAFDAYVQPIVEK